MTDKPPRITTICIDRCDADYALGEFILITRAGSRVQAEGRRKAGFLWRIRYISDHYGFRRAG